MSSSFSEFTQPGKKPVVNSIFDFSAEALGEIRLWLEQNPPAVPITSVLGYSQTTPHRDVITASETTTSEAYVDLFTVGPTLSALPNGVYLVLIEATMNSTVAGNAAFIGPSVNSGSVLDQDCAISEATDATSCIGISLQTLSAGSNTIQAKYRVNAAATTGSFLYRNLVAIKQSNL